MGAECGEGGRVMVWREGGSRQQDRRPARQRDKTAGREIGREEGKERYRRQVGVGTKLGKCALVVRQEGGKAAARADDSFLPSLAWDFGAWEWGLLGTCGTFSRLSGLRLFLFLSARVVSRSVLVSV